MRPFIQRYEDLTFNILAKWTTDPNPHVRRLTSECSRPRLPWAERLQCVENNPFLTRTILETLKDDADLYVRRSVANHLGDLYKNHPDYVMNLLETWIKEGEITEKNMKNRFWLIRHALRYPAKQGNNQAVQLRKRAQ